MTAIGIALVALVIAVGLVGIVVPILPGALLVYGAIAVWAVMTQTVPGWVVLAVVTVLIGTSTIIKYTWPVRRMRQADIGRWSLFAGAVLGIVGFFVVPVLGLLLGFVVGVYLAELLYRRDQRVAWASTVHAIKGVALSVGVEFTGSLLAAIVWVVGVVVS